MSDLRQRPAAPLQPSASRLVELTTRLAVVFLYALAGVACVSHARLLWPFTVDDTFITLRYAARLAAGRGLSWNEGEAPVEGYTSFLWTLLLAPAHWFVGDAEAIAKLTSLGASGLLLGLVAGAAAWLTPGAPVVRATTAGLAAALLALDPSSAVHAVSGMDTALFALFSTAVFAALVIARSSPGPRPFAALSVLGLACGITRPEGNLVFAVGIVVLLVGLTRAQRRLAVRALLLGYVLPGALYFAWRYATYGLLFPLPVYAKAVKTHAFFAGAPEALSFARDLLWRNPLWAVCAVVGAASLRSRSVPALCGAASLLVASLKPAPLMAYEHRYLYPLVPFLSVLAALGLVTGCRAAVRRVSAGADAALPAVCAAVALCAFTAYAQVEHLRAAAIEFRDYGAGLRRAHVSLGRALAATRSGVHTPRVALLDAGAVAYYSQWHVIDTFGLNDRHVALNGRGDAAYVLGRSPDALVVVSSRSDAYVPVFDYEAELHRAAGAAGYVFWRSYAFAQDYHLRVLVRPGTKVFAP